MRIAVVGAGVSGLVCAHLLHGRHEVTVYEAQPRPGGHAHTVEIDEDGRRLAVDTGFIVYNERTYPLFTRLLARLGVATRETTMSFSVRCEASGIEYNGGSLAGLVARPANLLDPRFRRMLRQVPRFWRDARALLARPDEKVALGDFLAAGGYDEAFLALHLRPMLGAIWSTPEDRVETMPALALARFLENHGLLQVRDRPRWRVVEGGSARYVERLAAPLGDRLRAGLPVRRVLRREDGVEVEDARGGRARFDHVVLATHAPTALRLLADPGEAERAVLGAFRTWSNEVVLHTDERLLPRRQRARAAGNAHRLGADAARGQEGMAVTYWMNLLQGLEARRDYCVTLNRTDAIRPERILRVQRFAHPVFDGAALAAQRLR
ncbi:MAG: FAD-dependent oxidoreductase, partial [Myxococcota bacterium]|nr:FAD-dependent oxidoreductase [Myxococcota bacterium]